MEEDAGSCAIVRTIVSLARELRIGVIAEGIETAEQARMLREMGCEMGQGFFYSKPVAASDAETLLREARLRKVTGLRALNSQENGTSGHPGELLERVSVPL
ncbi:MAG: EAL domain-containing protein [Acidobacteriota bacterium]